MSIWSVLIDCVARALSKRTQTAEDSSAVEKNQISGVTVSGMFVGEEIGDNSIIIV